MQLGSRCCHRLPCRRTSIRSHQPKLMPRFLVSAARYARAVRRRRQVSRFRSTPQVRRPMESRALLGSDRLAALFASPGPVDLPESMSSIPVRFIAETRKLQQCRFSLRSDRLATFLPSLPFRSNRPKALRPSRVCSARPARRLPRHRIRSTWFDPKVHLGFPGRSSGPGAIIRRVSAVPATGGLRRSDAEASHLRFRCLDALPFSPVARFDERRSAATRGHSARRPPVRVRSVRCIVRPSRFRAPFGRSSAAVPTSKSLVLTLRIGRASRRSSP